MLPEDELLVDLSDRSAWIVDTVIERLYGNMPSYSVVPREQLVQSIEEIIELAIGVIRSGVVPPPQGIGQARRSATARSRQNVPIQDIMRAFRFTIGGIHEALHAAVERVRFPPERAIEMTNLLWRFSDAYSASQVNAYQASEINRVLSRERAVQGFLQTLMSGEIQEFALRQAALELDLDADGSYVAVRAQVRDGEAAERLRAELEVDARRRRSDALFAVVGSGVVGVAGSVPQVDLRDGVIAASGSGSLHEMSSSFLLTARLLAAAVALGESGLVSVETLSWRLAAAQSVEVNDHLAARYLEPLRSQGPFGEMILDAVSAYLSADRSIPAAARATSMHVNTLRYRLRRFEELTRCSLGATDTLVDVVVALRVTARLEARGPQRSPRP